jgi:O-methyltransferase
LADERGLRFENAAFSGVQAFREPHAVRPRPGTEALRAAYLDVLKLSLCELAGTRTTSVFKDHDGIVKSREIGGDELRIRAAGMDWPLRGLTMAGLSRLDDLQACVESVVADRVEGDLVEAGTWRGGSSILMRATLDTLGADDRTVCVADSFQGFPAPEGDALNAELAEVDFLAVPLDEVRANFARFGLEGGVEFVPGFFEETLHTLRHRRWSIVRLDGDTYSATWTTLEELYPGLSVGGYLIVDDYGALEECQQAVDDFRRVHGIDDPIEQVDWTCARWRRTTDAPIERAAPPEGRTTNTKGLDAPAREQRRIPTAEEVEADRVRRLREDELRELRAHAAAVEAEVRALRSSPLRGPKAWLRDRVGRGARA